MSERFEDPFQHEPEQEPFRAPSLSARERFESIRVLHEYRKEVDVDINQLAMLEQAIILERLKPRPDEQLIMQLEEIITAQWQRQWVD